MWWWWWWWWFGDANGPSQVRATKQIIVDNAIRHIEADVRWLLCMLQCMCENDRGWQWWLNIAGLYNTLNDPTNKRHSGHDSNGRLAGDDRRVKRLVVVVVVLVLVLKAIITDRQAATKRNESRSAHNTLFLSNLMVLEEPLSNQCHGS
jgi:hypothetical protein